MRALLFADRGGAELAPLTDALPTALLPVAGRELLVQTVEELVAAGIRELVVVAGVHADRISAVVGDGRRWGARLRVVLSRGEEDPALVWPRVAWEGQGAVLALRADLLRAPAVAAFLDRAHDAAGAAVCAGAGDPRGALILLRPGCPNAPGLLAALRWQDPAALPGTACVALDAAVRTLEDLPAYHRANLDRVAGRFPGPPLPGRPLALGLTAGMRARVSPRSLKQGAAFVGARSRVHPEAELLGEVVIADDVVVDRAATLIDSLILSHSYVGDLVDVRNAIVAGDLLIRVDTGARLRVSDAFLLGDLRSGTAAGLGAALDRLLGALLLVLSLPLWPLAAAAAALAGGGSLVESRSLEGNRPGAGSAGTFRVPRFRTGIPVLRNLPLLLAVVRGDLRLVGVSPLTPEESAGRSEDWQRVRDQAPAGLLGPTQLDLPPDAPLEERLLSDAFYARGRGPARDLGWLWAGMYALFTPRAWGFVGGDGPPTTAGEVRAQVNAKDEGRG